MQRKLKKFKENLKKIEEMIRNEGRLLPNGLCQSVRGARSHHCHVSPLAQLNVDYKVRGNVFIASELFQSLPLHPLHIIQ